MGTVFVDEIKHQSAQGSGTITIGASGETVNVVGTLQNNGAGVGGTNTPAFYANLNSNQVISSGVHTKLAFNTEVLDTDNCYDTTNYRFTPNVAGYYSFNLSLRCDNATTTEWWLYIKKNNSDTILMVDVEVNNWGFSMNALLYANGTTDYFEPYLYQGSGANRNALSSNNTTRFSAYKIIE